jgi:hypothetical protein
MRITLFLIALASTWSLMALMPATTPAQNNSDRAVTNHAPGQFYQAQGPFHHKRHNPFYRPMKRPNVPDRGDSQHRRHHGGKHYHHHYYHPVVPYYHPPVYYYQPRNFYYYRFGW